MYSRQFESGYCANKYIVGITNAPEIYHICTNFIAILFTVFFRVLPNQCTACPITSLLLSPQKWCNKTRLSCYKSLNSTIERIDLTSLTRYDRWSKHKKYVYMWNNLCQIFSLTSGEKSFFFDIFLIRVPTNSKIIDKISFIRR